MTYYYYVNKEFLLMILFNCDSNLAALNKNEYESLMLDAILLFLPLFDQRIRRNFLDVQFENIIFLVLFLSSRYLCFACSPFTCMDDQIYPE